MNDALTAGSAEDTLEAPASASADSPTEAAAAGSAARAEVPEEAGAAETAPKGEPAVTTAPVVITPARQVASILLGWASIALVDVVVFATRPYGRTPIKVRATAELVSVGYLLAIGVAVAAAVAAWRRFGPRSRVATYGAVAAASWALGYFFYGEDLSGAADQLATRIQFHPLRMALLTLGLSLSVPLALALGRYLVRSWHWSLGLALGIAGVIANGIEHDYPEMHLFISQSYPGVHVLVAVLAGLSASLTFERAPVPERARAVPRRAAYALAGAAALWGVLAVTVLPSNAVLLDLQRYPGAVLFPFLGPLHSQVRGTPNVPPGKAAWFTDRSSQPDVPPSTRAVREDAIVLLLGIDSMRADLLEDEKYREALPELFRLRDESVVFTNARSAGASTAPSLSALFSGVYYSQLYWTSTTLRDTSLVFPHQDTRKRFPELLSEADVETVTSAGAAWLGNSDGIVRGFDEEDGLPRTGTGYTLAKYLLKPIIARLKTRETGKQFYFVHMLDAHSPYTSAGKRSTPFLGYLAELGRVDKQIGLLRKELKASRLHARTTIIVMADHGEAFGEHGTRRHAVSLYDELLRVPLVIHTPNAKHRVVSDPVSLMDLGPTILDLMDVATPGSFMGQSLVGYLQGDPTKLERPIVAEARLKRAMILPDGFKVIYDTRTHVVEIYDLTNDPREEVNLYREDDPRSAERLGVLTAFFDAHTLKRPGYKVPYRKW